MTVIAIAGAGTDIGKTYVAAGLIRALRRRGHAVEALKPVVSGIEDDQPQGSDPARLIAALGAPLTPESLARMSPFRYRAPLSPPLAAWLEGRVLRFEAVLACCRERAAGTSGLLLIEMAGGVMSPLDDSRTGLDLLEALGAPVLLVSGAYLGAISHGLTALETLRGRGLSVAAMVVSESPGDNPPFEETVSAFRGFGGGVPVVAAPRRPEQDWDADDLARLLTPAG
ncbi:dethiobiotin synthase [Caulobacter sp. CCUG 60055]|uniref:dethiobiotin synthase n=1 Tax=Caulobacter sp. CCUG 60055 TaxID=2100090 RepID=UPI001FA733FA|nr:dethiobiotin synthase [Caulobacter sp. CCUG 60055]MCI3182108.1 dethiobiotin synthase [Caulobacter sp. CCUG 60055]